MTLDITKPVQTRDGRPVTLETTRASNTEYPLCGRVLEGEESHDAGYQVWTEEGRFFGRDIDTGNEHRLDLVNVPDFNAAVKEVTWREFRNDTAKRILASASRETFALLYPARDGGDETIVSRAIERADELVRQLRAAA